MLVAAHAGIPPVMGAHLMASGFAAPISVSKGAGINVYKISVPYAESASETTVVLHATSAAAGNSICKAVVRVWGAERGQGSAAGVGGFIAGGGRS